MSGKFRGKVREARVQVSRGHRHSAFYREYMQSQAWRDLRVDRIEHAGFRCERCGVEGTWSSLQVHHLHYETLGEEEYDDLKVVCIPCHEIEDEERAARTEAAVYEKRLDGWATKVYGEYWYEDLDYDEVNEAFETWLGDRE
jgi:5-methylcytosine-specific restriction endonuclease McrA